MLQWMKKKAKEQNARLEEEEQRKEQLLQYKKNVLDIVGSGNLPGISFDVDGGKPPFIFRESEQLLWIFSSVEYLEQKTHREDDEVVSKGIGLLAVTTKHVYFKGDRRSLRIPFSKIVSVELVSVDRGVDGVGITRDRASGHPEFFVVGREDAEFARDLILSVPSVEISGNSEVVSVGEYHLRSPDDGDSPNSDVE